MAQDISKSATKSEGHQLIPLSRTPEFKATFGPLGVIQMSLEKAIQPFRTKLQNRPSHHLLFYVIEGEYAAWRSSGSLSLPEGSLYSVQNQAVRQISLVSDRGTNIFFFLRPSKHWDERFRKPRQLQNCSYIQHLHRAVTGYLESVNSADLESENLSSIYVNLLKELLLRERQASMTPAESINRQRLGHLQHEISACPEKPWTVSDMAVLISVSESHLFSLCRDLIGKSPLELVIEHRMRKACLLLQTTDETIQEIAMGVGYQSEYSFSRLFLKHIGVRPGKYRRS